MIKIEKDVPLPRRKAGGRNTSEFTEALEAMEIGDSILVQMASHTACNRANTWSLYHKNGKKFATRAIEKGVTRIWRVE